jgi:hypothetical protein
MRVVSGMVLMSGKVSGVLWLEKVAGEPGSKSYIAVSGHGWQEFSGVLGPRRTCGLPAVGPGGSLIREGGCIGAIVDPRSSKITFARQFPNLRCLKALSRELNGLNVS